jgi:hypothetical protein
MVDEKMIQELSQLPWLKVKKRAAGHIAGRYYGLNGAAVRFFLSYSPDCVYLRLRQNDALLLENLIEKIGPPQLQWCFCGLFSRWYFYAWELNPERCESLYRSISLAAALKTGLDRYFGHRDIRRFTKTD